MNDDIVVGFEDAVGEPAIAHELPDVLDRVQLGAFGRQWQQRDIGRYLELCRGLQSCLMEDEHGMGTGSYAEGGLRETYVFSLGDAARHDDSRAIAFSATDGAENEARAGALVLGP